MFFQELAYLLSVSATGLSLPFRKRSWWVRVIKTRISFGIESSNKGWNTKWSHTTSLGELLFSFSNMFSNVLDWWVVIIIESVTLTLHSRFISKDSSISSQSWIGHMYVLVNLNNFLDSPTFLQFGDGFFLNEWYGLILILRGWLYPLLLSLLSKVPFWRPKLRIRLGRDVHLVKILWLLSRTYLKYF